MGTEHTEIIYEIIKGLKKILPQGSQRRSENSEPAKLSEKKVIF